MEEKDGMCYREETYDINVARDHALKGSWITIQKHDNTGCMWRGLMLSPKTFLAQHPEDETSLSVHSNGTLDKVRT
jgi:hypothetical protein